MSSTSLHTLVRFTRESSKGMMSFSMRLSVKMCIRDRSKGYKEVPEAFKHLEV